MDTFEDILNRLSGNKKKQDEEEKNPAAQQQGQDFDSILNILGAGRRDTSTQLVDTYVADIQDFSKNVGAAWEGMGYNNYQDTIRDYTGQREQLLQRTDELIGYLNENADLYETESLEGMLEWLEENKTYLRNVGTGLEQQKGFFESFISEKDYTLYDTYKETSAEELREIAKTQQDWETRDWMEKRASALEYKAPRALDVIDGELATVKEQLKQQEAKDLKALEEWSLWFSTEGASSPYAKAPANGGESEETRALKKRLSELESERQAAVSQERAASAPKLPDTVEKLDAELARIQEEINISFANDQRRAADMGVVLVSKSKKTEELEATQTQLMQKRASILAEDLLGNKYAYVMEAPDFGDKSKYAGMKNILADSDYGYINGDKRAEDLYDYTLNNPRQRLLGMDRTWVTRMRENEKKIYNYLYNTAGRSKANEFLSELEPVLLKRQREDEERFARWDAQEDPWGTSIATVLSAPLKPLAFVGQTIDSLDGTIDPNAAYNRNIYTSKAIREEVPKNWGPVGSFAYQTGMSMADFLTTTAVAGGNPTIAMTIMGSGAAADTTLEALDRGLSSSQAYNLGVVAGIAEALTERFSLDALLDKTALTKSALGYWLKNVLAEGSEEVSSSLINNFADLMISKDKSQWAQSVQAYKDKGFSDSKAFWKAMGDQAASLGLDFLGGAASGGVIGMPGVVMKGAGLVSNTQSQGQPGNTQQVAAQEPSKVVNAPQVAVQNPVAAEQNPVIPEQNHAKAEQTTVKTEQQTQVPSQSGEIRQAVNSRDAMQRKLQAAEEAYSTGVISKKELQKVRREAEALNITTTIPETDRVDIQGARAAYEAGEIDEETYYQIEDAYREQQEQLGTAPAVDEQIQYTENENQELSFAQQQRLAESQKEGANYETEELEPTLIGNGGLVGGWIRKSVPDGGSQRTAGAGTRGEAGQLSGSAAEQTATANPGRAAIQRRNLAQNLRLDKVSSEALVPGRGTVGKKNTILPAENWDTQMQEVAERVKRETGKEVVYVLGGIEVKTKHGTKTVNGVYDGTQIIIRADHLRLSIEQIADHEMYHDMTDANGGRYQLNAKLRDYILERYDMQSFSAILDKYVEGLRGIVDFSTDMDPETAEDAMLRIEEEIYADAYAGINAFGAHAEQLQEIVRPWAEENMLPQARKQDNGTRQTNGPPADARFSIETLPDGKKYVRADRQVIFGNDPDSWSEQVEDYINGRIRRGQDVTLIAEDGDVLTITSTTAGKLSDYHTSRGTTMSDEEFYLKANAAVHIDELAKVSRAVPGVNRQDVGGRHGEFASGGWSYRTAYFMDFDGKYYRLRISAAKNPDGTIVYNIGDVKERSFPTIDGSSAKGGALGGKTSFEKRVPQEGRTVKEKLSVDDTEPDYRFSVDDGQNNDRDSQGNRLTPAMQVFFARSQARDDLGRLLLLYHQTAEDFTVFDTRRPGAGSRDGSTPFGIFLKRSARDIGLQGKKQMALYANITNPLRASNREDLTRQLREISSRYAAIADSHKQLDAEYHEKFEQAKKAWRDYIIEWRAANPNANRSALNDDPRYNELFDAEDAVIEEWTAAADKLDAQAKEAITEDLRKAGYDGIFLENDTGSWGRQTDAIIALDPQQVKNVSNKKPTDNPDIRFSRESDFEDEQYATGPEIDQQEAVEELREREEAEYAEVKEKLASGELKPREELTTKAKNYLQKAERTLLNRIRYALSVPRVAAREYLKGTVEQLSAEFLATGRFTQETVDRLFEDAWNQGVIEDRERYDNYKHIKDFLRTSAVTISETDSHDIADYRDFKRRAWGTLKIVNEGGQGVDSLYTELMDMAPELFPADITHPADQLVKMYDVGKSITITEQNLNSIGGEFGRQMKLEAREAFEDAMQAVRADLRNVKRAADDLAERKRSEQEKPTYDSVEKVIEAYENMKKARRVADKAVASNLLTARDEMLVGRLLRGEILPEDLNPETDNVAGITEVYEAKKAYEALAKPLVEYKKKMKAHLLNVADTFLETSNSWKDKSKLHYSRETMIRNIRDIVPDKALAKEIIEYFFEPIAKQEAERTRFKTKMRQRVAALKLRLKADKGNLVSESHAVQLLGEALDNIQCLENAKGYMKTRDGKTLDEWHAVIQKLWEENPNLDRTKIKNAVDAFREIYDELFKLMNEVRVRFGYEPVNYRRGYFPHFQQQSDGIMAQFGRALGIDTTVEALPTSITGITHTFKPGMRWFGNTMERLGFGTTYDAVGGFDMYIEGVSDVIFQTENIQKLRALASQIRYRTTDDGIREQIDKIKADTSLTEEKRDALIRDIYTKGKFVLNNFIKELDEYTNLLANKKSSFDRWAEEYFGRGVVYKVGKLLNSRVAANMVVGNLTSPLTNLIPIVQAMSRTGTFNMLHGIWDTTVNFVRQNKLIQNVFNVNGEPDGIDEISDFLTNRRGSELLSKTTMQKAQDLAGSFMEAMDMFTSGSVVRAEYYHNLKKGLTEQEAMHQADLFAAGVIADRSKGSMPTIFASQTLKPITGFQLEVNNQISEIFKDLPRYYDDEEKGKLILAFLGYFIGANIFNAVYELVMGRRAAMDPLYILNELSGDLFGYQLPSLYEMVQGDFSFKTERETDASVIIKNTVSNVVSELPFNSLLGLAGFEGGGRVPVASAMPDLVKLISTFTDDEADDLYKWYVAQDEILGSAAYVIPPFGGGQVLKMAKGVHALIRGGSHTVNKKGEEQMQYPIYTDTVGQAIWNGFKTVMFGKNSTGGALEWVGSNFDTFSAKYTEVYRQMVAAGVKQRDAFDLVNELRHIRKTEEETQKFLQRRVLQNSDVSDDGKLVAYNGIIASESEQDLIVALTGVDDNSGAILKTLYGMKEAEDLEGEEKTKAKLQVLDSSGLNAEGQLTAFYDLLAGESEREAIEELDTLGADSASVYDAVRNIREAELLKGDAEASAKWQAVADADLTDAQKNVLAGCLFDSTEMETESGEPSKWAKLQEGRKRGLSWSQYSQMVSYEITLDSYLKYTSEGLGSDEAIEALIETEGVEPVNGMEQIADVQKYLVIAERPWNETMKDMALEGIMSESAYEKYRAAADAGIRTYIYITFLYDINGWTSDKDKSKQDKIVEYIDGLNLTVVQKDALYLTLYTEKNLHKTPWHR